MQLTQVPLTLCVHSRFNTRKTRDGSQVERLADRIRRNGFEPTRALWAVQSNGHYEVFAGGTRMEAARLAELKTVPVFVHEGPTARPRPGSLLPRRSGGQSQPSWLRQRPR